MIFCFSRISLQYTISCSSRIFLTVSDCLLIYNILNSEWSLLLFGHVWRLQTDMSSHPFVTQHDNKNCSIYCIHCVQVVSTITGNVQSPNFKTFKEPKNQFQGTNSAMLCSLAGRYNNPIPTRFLAPIDCLKIPAQVSSVEQSKLPPTTVWPFLLTYSTAESVQTISDRLIFDWPFWSYAAELPTCWQLPHWLV